MIALVFSLYAGGLDTDWQRIRPVLAHGLALSTLGVLLKAALTGLFAILALGFTPLQGLLLGAIVSSTDAAAVFTVLEPGDHLLILADQAVLTATRRAFAREPGPTFSETGGSAE